MSPEKLRLLVVDDTPEIRGLFSIALSESVTLVEAGNADDAKKIIDEQETFDGIITDDELGTGQTGVSLIKEIKELPKNRQSYFIIYTATPPDIEKTKEKAAYAVGADEFWQAPFQEIDLIEGVPARITAKQQQIRKPTDEI